jgi:uncharacterized membrane protein YoaK (UPF0700 family)
MDKQVINQEIKQVKRYSIYEEIHVGMLLTMVSGYLDSFTYFHFDEHFASLQSGNLIMMGTDLANGKFLEASNYLIPIFLFMLGAAFSTWVKEVAARNNYHRHILSTRIEFIGMVAAGILSFFLPSIWTAGVFAFFAAIQADTFSKLRGLPYTTIMSTGNLKSTGAFLFSAIYKKDKEIWKKACNVLRVVLTFFAGALLSGLLSRVIGHLAVFGAPLILLVLLFALRKGLHDEEELKKLEDEKLADL